MNRIYKLSPQLANQIAAGEVVERPASVVKELVENSIDAGATKLEINIEQGGKKLIQIRDNGVGIAKEDLSLALARHATSKLKHLSDFDDLTTLGFRGEALGSICSVSQLTLTSRPVEQDNAWQVAVAGEDMIPEIKPAAHPVGTTVEVRDLFFNTPARRKFLRTDKTEFGEIDSVVKRLVLSRLDLAITFRHQQKTILQLTAADSEIAKEKRIQAIFGSQFLPRAIRVDTQNTGLRLWGWIGLPEFSRSQADLQYFYLNGRIVRDKLINHALKQAYADTVYPGRYPGYLLYLEIEPQAVDVNVHPTKHEIRFHEARLTHDFIVKSVESVIAHQDPNLLGSTMPNIEPSRTPQYLRPMPPQLNVREQLVQYRKLIEPKLENSLGKVVGLVASRYLIVEIDTGILIIDCLEARKFLVVTALELAAKSLTPVSVPLLIPVAIETKRPIDPESIKYLETVGFNCHPVSEASLIIRAIPQALREVELKPILQDLLSKVIDNQDHCIKVIAAFYADEYIQESSSSDLNSFLQRLSQHFQLNQLVSQPFVRRVILKELYLT